MTHRNTTLNLLRNKLTAPLLALGFVGSLGMSTASAKPADGAGKHKRDRIERLCKKIACTDGQRTQLKAIHKDAAKSHKGKSEQARQLKAQMAAEFRKQNPSERVLTDISNKLAQHKDAKRAARIKMMLKVHRILNPEQREQLAKVLEKRGPGALMGKGKGKRKHAKRGKQGKRGKGQRKGQRKGQKNQRKALG
ncbi:MAG: Spy/CpxP family protein refolding chaperone [Nannocystaceae bacterium]